MKLTRKKAFELSIKKWEWIVENNGKLNGLTQAIPEIVSLAAHCGLCEYNDLHEDGFCGNCPIKVNGKSCGSSAHPWSIWYDSRTKENAEKVLDLIKSKL